MNSEWEIKKHIENRCKKKKIELLCLVNKIFTINHRPRFLLKGRGYFAGGCFTSLMQKQEPKDWDVFLTTEHSAKQVHDWFSKKKDERIICITDNAITLEGGFQIITCTAGLHIFMVRDKFDFLHCRSYFDFFTDTLKIFPEAWELSREKRLVVNPKIGIDNVSPERVQRFVNRGWTLDQGEYEGLKALAEVDLGETQFQDSGQGLAP